MTDRLDDVATLRMPAGGATVQLRDLLGSLTPQLEAQQIDQQVVVAEPRAARVDRDDKRVRLLQPEQQPGAVTPTGQQVREGDVDALKDARAQQQPTHLWPLER